MNLTSENSEKTINIGNVPEVILTSCPSEHNWGCVVNFIISSFHHLHCNELKSSGLSGHISTGFRHITSSHLPITSFFPVYIFLSIYNLALLHFGCLPLFYENFSLSSKNGIVQIRNCSNTQLFKYKNNPCGPEAPD